MSALPRLIGLAAPFRWWLVLAALLSFATLAAGVALMAMSAFLISKAAVVSGFSAVALAVAAVRGFAITRAALRYAERYTSHLATFRILTRLRVWFYTAVEPLAPAGLREYRSGDLLSRIAADIGTLDGFYVRVLLPPSGAALAMLFAAGIVGAFDLRLAFVLLAALLAGAAIVPLVTRWMSRTTASRLATARGDLSVALADEVHGMAEAVAFGRAKGLHQRTLTLGDEMERAQQRLALARSINGALVALIAGAAGLAILLLAIPLVETGSIDGVYLALLPLTALASFEAVHQIASASEQIDPSRAAARRVFEIIDAQDEALVLDEPLPATQDHRIEFRNVSFRFGEAEPPVLEDVSFRVCSGDRLAITGPSGAGKTTIVNLLLRFWDCRDGEILIGGQNIAACDQDDVRRLIGVVPQDVYLFNGTVRDNLLLGKGDASDEELAEACRRACLDEVIAALPNGYDTLVGENGYKLSGGERQRLAIARVMLKNAPILILDEATSNLDPAAEEQVTKNLDEFMVWRTSLIVAHEPDSLGLRCETFDLGNRTI